MKMEQNIKVPSSLVLNPDTPKFRALRICLVLLANLITNLNITFKDNISLSIISLIPHTHLLITYDMKEIVKGTGR